MRSRSVVAVFFAVAGAGPAWAQGIGAAGAASVASTPSASATAASTAANAAAAAHAAAALPAPPPSSVTIGRIATSGVPPTPAPATPGLPSPPSSAVLPSQQGFGVGVANELRPSPSLDAAQVADVQATLAAGGLYRGPIDGNMTGATRAAIQQFQAIQALPATGNLDAETASRLVRGAAAGNIASNGGTSTVGNRAAAGDPFSATFTNVPATSTTTGGTLTTPTTPFSISTPLNTSPSAPPGIMVQP